MVNQKSQHRAKPYRLNPASYPTFKQVCVWTSAAVILFVGVNYLNGSLTF